LAEDVAILPKAGEKSIVSPEEGREKKEKTVH